MMHVAIIRGVHSFHDSWAEAIEHVERVCSFDHSVCWFRTAGRLALVYELRPLQPFRSNRGTWAPGDRHVAEVIEYQNYQTAKLRGDLE